MADDVENPRKKQRLEASHPLATEFPTSSDHTNDSNTDVASNEATRSHEEVEDRMAKNRLNLRSEQPSSSRLDLDDSNDSTTSSSLSPLSGEEMWKGDSEPIGWVYQMMASGQNPRTILEEIMTDGVPNVDEFSLWRILLSIVSEPPPREKLDAVNTLADVINLIKTCQNIVVLTGAGVSVSCGIPDFRSRNGIYARLAVDFPSLPDPQAMFDIRYFRGDQRPFYKFAKEIYPGQFEPSKCHRFIKLIEEHGKLLRNYTQNIDTLEQVAGIENVIQCHGSFATATCMTCKYKCSGDDIKQQIFDQVIPKCLKCDPPTEFSIMKPDIVFFGESLPEEFHKQMAVDKEKCDLLIVIGSSLKVRPVALIPNSIPGNVPQILINKEHLRNLNFDVELLGDCEIIIGELCRHLGDTWETLANKTNPLTEIKVDELMTPPTTPKLDKDSGDTSSASPKHDKGDGDKMSEKPEVLDDNVDSSTDIKADNKSPVAGTSQGDTNEAIKIAIPDNSNKTEDSKDKTTSKDIVKSQGSEANVESETSVSSTQELPKASQSDISDNNKVDNVVDSSVEPNKVDSKVESNVEHNEVTGKSHSTVETSIEADTSVEPNVGAISIDKENNNKTDDEDMVDSTADIEQGAGYGLGFLKRSQKQYFRAGWMPAKWKVSQRLAPNQYCFMPPNRYVFNDTELFMTINSDSDSSDSDVDCDLDESDKLKFEKFIAEEIVDETNNEVGEGNGSDFDVDCDLDESDKLKFEKFIAEEIMDETNNEVSEGNGSVQTTGPVSEDDINSSTDKLEQTEDLTKSQV